MHNITSAWTELLQQFLPIFTTPTGEVFIRLITGWILCTARRTVTGIVPFADPLSLRTHDAYHRFFPNARWSMPRLWQTLATILVRTFCRNGVITLALDDTLFHHSGRKVDGAAWWRDAVRSTSKSIVYAWGLNLVVITLQIQPLWGGEPLGLPVNMRLHRKNGPTLIELAMEMINEVRQWLPQRSYRVVGDGFYATLAGKDLDGVAIISRIKRNANLFDLPPKRKKKGRGRPRTKGKKLAKLEKMAAHIQNWEKVTFRQRGKTIERLVYTRTVLWYKVSRKPILLVISRDPDRKEKDDFFFTTDSDGFEYDCRRGAGMLQRQMGHRRHVQKYQTASWRTTAADIQRQGTRTCGRPEPLAVLGGLAVVSQAKIQPKIFLCSAVVLSQDNPQLCRCDSVPSPRALEGQN